MTFDAAAIDALFAAVTSKALSLAVFDRVTGHEPKNAPGRGLSCAFWLESVRPAGRASGLNITSGVITFGARIYQSFLTKPEDGIDPDVLAAASALLAAYSGSFTLSGTVLAIDLLGAYGPPLGLQAGYTEQDGKHFRITDITIPIVIADLWGQAP